MIGKIKMSLSKPFQSCDYSNGVLINCVLVSATSGTISPHSLSKNNFLIFTNPVFTREIIKVDDALLKKKLTKLQSAENYFTKAQVPLSYHLKFFWFGPIPNAIYIDLKAPLCITIRIKTWLVAYFFNFLWTKKDFLKKKIN